MPLDEAGDEDGQFKGLRVQAMKIRLTEYANELLQSINAEGDRNDVHELSIPVGRANRGGVVCGRWC